jgi:hypothetical protein
LKAAGGEYVQRLTQNPRTWQHFPLATGKRKQNITNAG